MKKYTEITFNIIFKIFIFLLFLFARTFTGVSIFGFRLGEYLIGGSMVLLVLYFLILPLKNKSYYLDNKLLNLSILGLVISFFLTYFINSNQFSNLFVFKTSSYIWSIGGIILGIEIVKFINIKVGILDIYLSLFGLFVIYLFSTRGISENLQNFFLNYTDKFEYPKGSDILLAFIFVFIFVLNKLEFSKISFNLISIFFALLSPLLMVKSRSAFISSVIFMLLLVPSFKSKIKIFDKKIIITIFISAIIFILSTSWVVSRDLVVDEEITDELKYAITSRYSTINDNVYEQEYLKLRLFYFENGRIFSTDGNLNWRFQIWQDIVNDMWSSSIFVTGYGYEGIIPAMDSDQRHGQDKQNINVHNYFFHIFSRGGITSVTFALLFYYFLFKLFKQYDLHLDYFQITLPLLFNSLFDPCMENAHYPVIFYLLLGLTFRKYIIFKEESEN